MEPLRVQFLEVMKNKLKKEDQKQQFLNQVQQPKMKEIWDNKEDEAWEENEA